MNLMVKPEKLSVGDTIAVISPCHGWAGDIDVRWRYELGIKRLKEIGLQVVTAPNALKGTDYLRKNPQARAEDFMWAFMKQDVKAIIATVGGNDSIRIIPYINEKCIRENPKIFIGYSDVMNLHILCYKNGLSTFYGDNLLHPIAETQAWHEYSKECFQQVLYHDGIIGLILPAEEWTYHPIDYKNPNDIRKYYRNSPYELIQGKGVVRGRLFGGHTGLMELAGTTLEVSEKDFEDTILFLEDIAEFYTADHLRKFFEWMQDIKALRHIKGIILGKANSKTEFLEQKKAIATILSEKYSLGDLPVLYGLNFGHSSPMCILPYGVMAEVNCNENTFSILESGVKGGALSSN